MARGQHSPNSETLGVAATPLMRKQTQAYVENQKQADTYRNVSTYFTWGATALLGLLAVFTAAAFVPTLAATLGISGTVPAIAFWLTGVGGAVTAAGSIFTSRRATEISERSNVLYSDIDSQNQAHRMVQAFAKAQTQGQVQADNSAPMTSTAPSFVERYSSNRLSQADSWQERVTAQASLEEAQSLASTRG
ncbi:MAG: hypothetical protein ACOYJ2_08490 [Rickettsiales bacterium]